MVIQLLINSPVFIIIFAVFLPNDDSDIIFQSSLLCFLEKNTLEIKTLSCFTSKFSGFEFDLRPSEVNSGQNVLLFESPL